MLQLDIKITSHYPILSPIDFLIYKYGSKHDLAQASDYFRLKSVLPKQFI